MGDHGLKDDLSRCFRQQMSFKVAYEAVYLTRFILLSSRRIPPPFHLASVSALAPASAAACVD